MLHLPFMLILVDVIPVTIWCHTQRQGNRRKCILIHVIAWFLGYRVPFHRVNKCVVFTWCSFLCRKLFLSLHELAQKCVPVCSQSELFTLRSFTYMLALCLGCLSSASVNPALFFLNQMHPVEMSVTDWSDFEARETLSLFDHKS